MTLAPSAHPIFGATAHLPECDLPAAHNLNGTGRETLHTEYVNANRALNDLCMALSRITFHARDYYPISDHAHYDAVITRRKVFDLCDEIGAYLDAHIEHLSRP